LNFISTWNVVAPEPGVGALVAAGVGVGVLVATGVGVPAPADDDVVGVIADLPAGYAPQPPSATALTMAATIIRVRTLVKRQGG
jgi:hypothetical protein